MNNRKRIELHNYDKYQAYFHAPMVDRIEGDAEEMILSADGDHTSASGGVVGSLTMNASGGTWSNLGDVSRVWIPITHDYTSNTTPGTETFLTLPANRMCSVTLNIMYKHQNYMTNQRVVVVYDGATNVTVDTIEQHGSGTFPSGVSIDVTKVSDTLQFDISNLGTAVTIRGVADMIQG